MNIPSTTDGLLYGANFTIDGITRNSVPFKVGPGQLPLKVFDYTFSSRPTGPLLFDAGTTEMNFSGSHSLVFNGNGACVNATLYTLHSDGVSYVGYNVKWTPTYTIVPPYPSNPEPNHCEGESITVNATSAFTTGWTWMY